MISLLLPYLSLVLPGFDVPPLEHRFTNGRYCIEWTDLGIDAPAWSRDSDNKGHPDFIDSLAVDLKDSWHILADSFNLAPPRLDSASSVCQFHVKIMDILKSGQDGRDPIGIATVDPSAGYGLMFLDNDLDLTNSQPVPDLKPFPSKTYRGVIFHEMMHLFTPLFWNANADHSNVFLEQAAQWFTATRSGATDGHILTDSTTQPAYSLFDPKYRYSNWFWMEDIESRKGTSVVLDWIRFRSGPAAIPPAQWSLHREDSLFAAWFRSRNEYAQTWEEVFSEDLGLLVNRFNSPFMPKATAAIGLHSNSHIVRPISLDTRGTSERIIGIPPFSWVAVEQPRSWIYHGGQILTYRIDPPGSQAYVYGFGLEANPSLGGWGMLNLDESGIATYLDSLNPTPGVTGRHLFFLSGPDSTTLHLTATGKGTGCRARPVSISQANLGDLRALDDGDISTWIDPQGLAPIIVDLGADLPLTGIDMIWREPQSIIGTFTVKVSSDSVNWDSYSFPGGLSFTNQNFIDFSSGTARWIKFDPILTTSIVRHLSEIAIWTKGVGCIDPNPTFVQNRSVKIARLTFLRGNLEVVSPTSGSLSWISPNGALLGIRELGPGTWRIEPPDRTRLIIAVWTSGPTRLIARVPSFR